MLAKGRILAAGVALATLTLPTPASAQSVGQNAVANADDAFGASIGSDVTGIYSDANTRGFSPLKAGNARLDGIYFDPVATLPGRLRESSGIRVGIAASDYPFSAPTGIVDNKLRTAGDTFAADLTLTMAPYFGDLEELDLQIPVVVGRFAISAGISRGRSVARDGASQNSAAFAIKPVIRVGGMEISPFFAATLISNASARPIFVTNGETIPQLPRPGHYLGQTWALGRNWNVNTGITARAPLTRNLTVRAGVFRSSIARIDNFTEIFAFTSSDTVARHRLISDPRQRVHSLSGEAQLMLKLGEGKDLQHRLIVGYRGRNRYTESGGSDARDFGAIDIDGYDPEPEPVFQYSAVNVGRIRQTSWMLGYQGRRDGIGHINVGVQRTQYRATFLNARLGSTSGSREDAWLYNATITVTLQPSIEMFIGTQRGLEDSGAAPENAVNRNAQLPTTQSTQYEAGLRWRLGASKLVLSAFEISKPYFSFDDANRFVELGTTRYRGAELSFTGHFGDRLTLLAGAIALNARVNNANSNNGLVGKHPAGAPTLYARADIQYRTDLLDGITPTVTAIYTGRRAVGSPPVASLAGTQLMLAPWTSIDVGIRYQFEIGRTPASLRAQIQNIFDTENWKVIASNSLQPEEGRRFMAVLSIGL